MTVTSHGDSDGSRDHNRDSAGGTGTEPGYSVPSPSHRLTVTGSSTRHFKLPGVAAAHTVTGITPPVLPGVVVLVTVRRLLTTVTRDAGLVTVTVPWPGGSDTQAQ